MSTNAVNVATTAGAKDKAAGGAGAQFFLGGLLILISTSWAAANIIKKNDPGYNYNPNAPISGQGMYHTQFNSYYVLILLVDSHAQLWFADRTFNENRRPDFVTNKLLVKKKSD